MKKNNVTVISFLMNFVYEFCFEISINFVGTALLANALYEN